MASQNKSLIADMDSFLHGYNLSNSQQQQQQKQESSRGLHTQHMSSPINQDEQHSGSGGLDCGGLLGDEVEGWMSATAYGNTSMEQQQIGHEHTLNHPQTGNNNSQTLTPPSTSGNPNRLSPSYHFDVLNSIALQDMSQQQVWQHMGMTFPEGLLTNEIAAADRLNSVEGSGSHHMTGEGMGSWGVENHSRGGGGGAMNATTPASSGGNSGDNGNHGGGQKAKVGKEKEEKPVNRSHLTQRRYRERQKAKTADLVNKVSELRAENKTLLEERTDLLARNSMLLQLLQQRDKQLVEAQQRVSALVKRSSSSSKQSTSQEKSSGNVDGENANDLADSINFSLRLTVREEAPIELGPEQVRNLSQAEFASLWRDYVNKLALLLVAADNRPPQPPLLQRMEQLTGEAGALIFRASLPNPVGVKNFVSRKLENDTSVLSREDNLDAWVHTAATLGLSSEQRERCRQLRAVYMEKIGDVIRLRGEQLQALMDHRPSRLSTRKNASNFVKTTEVLTALKRSMDEETAMVADFVRTLYEQILTAMQRARYIVAAYPWTPDHLAFITAVAAQMGDREAAACLDQLQAMNQAPSDPESSC